MVILKEKFGPLLWIAFNKSWHNIAHCQRWPKGKSLLVHFLLNWKRQGTQHKVFLLLFGTNENFIVEFLMLKTIIDRCILTATGIKNKTKTIWQYAAYFVMSWVLLPYHFEKWEYLQIVEDKPWQYYWVLIKEGWKTAAVLKCSKAGYIWVSI